MYFYLFLLQVNISEYEQSCIKWSTDILSIFSKFVTKIAHIYDMYCCRSSNASWLAAVRACSWSLSTSNFGNTVFLTVCDLTCVVWVVSKFVNRYIAIHRGWVINNIDKNTVSNGRTFKWTEHNDLVQWNVITWHGIFAQSLVNKKKDLELYYSEYSEHTGRNFARSWGDQIM